jgi:hypothetical protein
MHYSKARTRYYHFRNSRAEWKPVNKDKSKNIFVPNSFLLLRLRSSGLNWRIAGGTGRV